MSQDEGPRRALEALIVRLDAQDAFSHFPSPHAAAEEIKAILAAQPPGDSRALRAAFVVGAAATDEYGYQLTRKEAEAEALRRYPYAALCGTGERVQTYADGILISDAPATGEDKPGGVG